MSKKKIFFPKPDADATRAYTYAAPHILSIVMNACVKAANPRYKRSLMRKRCHTKITDDICSFASDNLKLRGIFSTWGKTKVYDNKEEVDNLDMCGYVLLRPESHVREVTRSRRSSVMFKAVEKHPTYIMLFSYDSETEEIRFTHKPGDFEMKERDARDMLNAFIQRRLALCVGWFNNA